ncbi:MAG: imidazole glycerol phosphate synthase subunit HisH [Ignavibacteriales bacterium]
MKENNTKDVIVIDYKLGNLFSVKHACLHVGLNPIVTSDKEIIRNAKAAILPGVGAFSDAMHNLEKLDLVAPIKELVDKNIPLMGICLGLQLLFEESEEFGKSKGLGLIKGLVKKFPTFINSKKVRVPNIGWNTIYHPDSENWNNSPLTGIKQNSYMYFVHSFYVDPENKADILSLTKYEEIEYCSSINRGNIFATQYHPEKSSALGLEIYKNWAKFIN